MFALLGVAAVAKWRPERKIASVLCSSLTPVHAVDIVSTVIRPANLAATAAFAKSSL